MSNVSALARMCPRLISNVSALNVECVHALSNESALYVECVRALCLMCPRLMGGFQRQASRLIFMIFGTNMSDTAVFMVK